ncbi:MAG: Ribosomal RNA small subunit methyltransferase A [Stenotrophomonas maltophilia]|uniref:Ribosomal RNA small subunit methyltransferase A n=1 Tax=Stenotrophomonas maltophilia TaxID=40324 RepID=A0A7V8FFP2_STEMA|nr:MAG: Ribosomal RNA small subunit methyltransferase A [Stenotrophomonas maltophilia]
MTSPHSPSAPAFTAPAKKQLGQHFLADRHYIDRIVMAVNPRDGDRLVEIGPGQGAITLPLLRVHPKLTVIEFDRDLIAPLTAAAEPLGELTIVQGDVLRVDFTALAAGEPIRLVSNLPYNISSPILFHALEHAAVVRDMHFMLQKEVVDRMAAGPGSKVFGRLSVMLQAYSEVTSLFVVPPGAFRPPPKVDSAVVRLVPRDPATIGINDHARFAEVVRAAFGQRRKTLRNALNNVVSADQFAAAGVRPDARAEQLDVAEFIALANAS